MRLSEQNATIIQLRIVTHLLSKDYLPIIKKLQQQSGVLPETLKKNPTFLKMASNIFYLGRNSKTKERGLQVSGNSINVINDLKKIISARSIEELNSLIDGSPYGDPAFGIDNVTDNQDVRKIKAFAIAFHTIVKKVTNNTTTTNLKKLAKNTVKAYTGFSNAVSNPGNTADILAQPFKNN